MEKWDCGKLEYMRVARAPGSSPGQALGRAKGIDPNHGDPEKDQHSTRNIQRPSSNPWLLDVPC